MKVVSDLHNIGKGFFPYIINILSGYNDFNYWRFQHMSLDISFIFNLTDD